jgi:hypothetical protein
LPDLLGDGCIAERHLTLDRDNLQPPRYSNKCIFQT